VQGHIICDARRVAEGDDGVGEQRERRAAVVLGRALGCHALHGLQGTQRALAVMGELPGEGVAVGGVRAVFSPRAPSMGDPSLLRPIRILGSATC
jgi:hypothetical protein